MTAHTSPTHYRVLDTAADGDRLLVLDTDAYEPTLVSTTGYDDLDTRVDGLRPGYAIEATLSWADDTARFESLTVSTPTLYTFARGVSGVFEVALDTWAAARDQGRGVNSQVTYSNDGDPNGALYTFADQPGERDIFEEFRTGRRPLEPLLDRVETAPPYEVFVFDVTTHDFVLVYIVLAKGSVLADTVRDTYDCPRPTEPLVADASTPSIPGTTSPSADPDDATQHFDPGS